jgi:hypothetical protein
MTPPDQRGPHFDCQSVGGAGHAREPTAAQKKAMGAILSPMAIEEASTRSGSAKHASKNGRSIPIFDAKARHAMKLAWQGVVREYELSCRHAHAAAHLPMPLNWGRSNIEG